MRDHRKFWLAAINFGLIALGGLLNAAQSTIVVPFVCAVFLDRQILFVIVLGFLAFYRGAAVQQEWSSACDGAFFDIGRRRII